MSEAGVSYSFFFCKWKMTYTWQEWWRRVLGVNRALLLFHFHHTHKDPLHSAAGFGKILTTTATINYMEHSPSWDTDSRLTALEIIKLLYKHKVHYRVHNNTPLDLLMNPVHTPISYIIILVLFSHLPLGLPHGLYSLAFRTIVYLM